MARDCSICGLPIEAGDAHEACEAARRRWAHRVVDELVEGLGPLELPPRDWIGVQLCAKPGDRVFRCRCGQGAMLVSPSAEPIAAVLLNLGASCRGCGASARGFVEVPLEPPS